MAAAVMAPVGLLAAGRVWAGYDPVQQTVSELVARDAPFRWSLSVFFILYNALLIGFGVGLSETAVAWEQARGRPGRYGRLSGRAVMGLGVLGIALLALPMDPVGSDYTPVGIAHTVVAGLMAALAGAAALSAGLWLREDREMGRYGRFSLAAAAVMALFGAATVMAVRADVAGGLAERLIIFTYEAWLLALGWKLYTQRPQRSPKTSEV
jgi:hypothetical protein